MTGILSHRRSNSRGGRRRVRGRRACRRGWTAHTSSGSGSRSLCNRRGCHAAAPGAGCGRPGPGAELQRLTPRNNDALLFDGLPWVSKAQEEHDAFTAVLESRAVEVLLLADLLTEALSHSGAARMHGISAAVDSRRLGVPLAQ